MLWGWIIKSHDSFQKILYKFDKEVLFHKFFSLFSPFDKHFPCFSSSFVYASVQPKILFSFLNVFIPHFPSHCLFFFHEKFPKWNTHLSDFMVYISCISHLALVQVIFYFYLYFKNKTHKDSKDVYNFTYSQYLE